MLTPDQESTKLFKHYLGTSDSKARREFFEEPINSSFTITPNQLWTYGDKIPVGDIARSMGIPTLDNNGIYDWQKSDSEVIPIVKRYRDFSFSAIDAGTDNAFVLRSMNGNNLQQIIPFNFSEDIYNYTLKTSTGKIIPFGVGDWVFDTFSGVLTFYGKVPVGVDHANPPLFSFFQYVGDMGFRQDRLGLDGVVLPLTEIEIPLGTSCLSSPILTSKLFNAAEKIAPDFVSTYGWDGSDKSEGIALSFESLIPITYANTKDPVKGYDDSASSDISAVISRIHPVPVTQSYSGPVPFEVSFINENAALAITGVPIQYAVEINGLTAKLIKAGVEGAPVQFIDKSIMLKDASDKTYIVLTKSDSAPADLSGIISFTLERRDDAVISLLYWSSSKKQYWPFVTKELASYDTGFPISVANGKVPPSLSIGSIPLSGYTDVITPDYYGPRVHNVIIAVEGTPKTKSADYVVKNSPGYFLDDVLNIVKAELGTDLPGTIFLRNGTYRVSSNTLSLSALRDVEIIGEDQTKVIITGPTDNTLLTASFIDESSLVPCNFGLKNLSIKNGLLSITSESGKTFVLDGILGINSDLNILKRVNPTILVKNCSFNTASFTTLDEVTEESKKSISFDTVSTLVYDSTFNSLTTNIRNSSIRGCYVKTASLNNGSIFFKENIVQTLATKVTGAVVQTCQIEAYGATINPNEYPAKFAKGAMPIYGAAGFNYLKYVNFDDPFLYDETSDLIKLKLDGEVLMVDSQGRLTTCLTADRINVGPLQFDVNAINDAGDEATRRKFEGGTLTEALSLLSRYKADLISGKVPLKQLPDAVAYGGLLYKGTWCFDTNSGKYPVANDLVPEGSPNDFSKENYINTLQPGWFVIVSPSPEALAANTPAQGQNTVNSTIYTAGDWCVWNGTTWEKLDRAYQDACYSILAAVDPDNNPWYWKQPGSTGWLDFSNVTIYEAFHRINDLFTSLIPKKPASINDGSISLQLKTLLKEYMVQTVATDGQLGQARVVFNVNEPGAKRAVIGIPDTSDRKGVIYYGDSSKLSAIIDGSVVGVVNLDTSKNNVQTVGALKVLKDVDPYSSENYGSGFWKGLIADISPIEDVQSLGNHIYSLVLDEALPPSVTPYVNGMKSKSFELIQPYTLTELLVGETSYTDLDPTLPNAKTALNACSGIYKLPGNFMFNLSTVLQKAVYDVIKIGERAFIKDSVDNEYIPIPGFSLDKTDESQPADRFFDLVVNNYIKEFTTKKTFDKFSFSIKVLGTLDENTVETPIITINTRIDNASEPERVTSGIGSYVYPVYNPDSTNQLNLSGKAFVSTSSLVVGNYTSELMKIGRNRLNPDGSYRDTVQEYKWPEGIHFYMKNKAIDYSSAFGTLLDQSFLRIDDDRPWMKTGRFRWVTFSKFISNESLSEVILKEASGFVLELLTADDKTNTLVLDDLSGSTKNIAIYAKVLGLDTISQSYLSDTELLNSGWLDCNNPYNGFSSPSANGDPAMYAGSSSATQKRITFGKTVKSGKLIVRVGITQDSGIAFQGVSIKEVI